MSDCSYLFRYIWIDFSATVILKHVIRLPLYLLNVLLYWIHLCVFSVYPETVHTCECLPHVQSISNCDTYRCCCVVNNNVEISASECGLILHFFQV